uniref:Uncharacterized protein n=1 Tax=Ditylenchus dipsaci TaxID=166011 RepID=A0A915DSE3_9BILA
MRKDVPDSEGSPSRANAGSGDESSPEPLASAPHGLLSGMQAAAAALLGDDRNSFFSALGAFQFGSGNQKA